MLQEKGIHFEDKGEIGGVPVSPDVIEVGLGERGEVGEGDGKRGEGLVVGEFEDGELGEVCFFKRGEGSNLIMICMMNMKILISID